MIYKVGILGATGRMGLEIAALLAPGYWQEKDCLELGDAVSGSKKFTSVEGTEVRTLGEPPREPVHVWLDFSRPEATIALLEGLQTPIVIGTTGFTPTQHAQIEAASRRIPILLSANLSPGMSQMRRWLRDSTPSGTWDAVVEETHHRGKKDAPSGSAKTLLEILRAKGFENIAVHSTRAGSERGTHRVRFVSDSEELVLEHRVCDRKVFAQGALVAALALLRRGKPGLYSLEEIE